MTLTSASFGLSQQRRGHHAPPALDDRFARQPAVQRDLLRRATRISSAPTASLPCARKAGLLVSACSPCGTGPNGAPGIRAQEVSRPRRHDARGWVRAGRRDGTGPSAACRRMGLLCTGSDGLALRREMGRGGRRRLAHEELLVDEEDVHRADGCGDRPGGGHEDAAVDVDAHDVAAAGEYHQRDERDRDAE